MSADLSVGLTCPVCGGSISVGDGEKNIECKYCNSALHIDGDEGVMIAAFKNKVTREQSIEAVRKWWKKGLKSRDLKTNGKIIECYPIYLPFWKIKVRTAGWVCGYEERRTTDSNGNVRVERIPLERMVLRDVIYSNIACDPGDLGIRKLHNFHGELTLEDFTMLPTFEAVTSKDDALSSAKKYAIDNGIASAGVPHITFHKVNAIIQNISMIYYPIWIIQYEHRERMYLATVDGVTCSILSGRAPGDALFQSLAVTGGAAAGGLVASASIPIALYSSPELGIFSFIIGIAISAIAYRFFRNGSERVEGDFKSNSKKSSTGLFENLNELSGLMGGMKI